MFMMTMMMITGNNQQQVLQSLFCFVWNAAENRSEEFQVRLPFRTQLHHRQATSQPLSILSVPEVSHGRHGQRRCGPAAFVSRGHSCFCLYDV